MTASLLGQAALGKSIALPLFSHHISAGFPSPAQDYVERTLDLNELCIRHPTATFFVKVSGDSMKNAGIYHEDILVVDRALHARHGDIVVAFINQEFTVKELHLKPQLQLCPHNPDYPVLPIRDTDEFEVFGVVTSVIRNIPRP
ncbi:translesion error-prone DNA polymerase V autoproteolytic subunit [Alishewanella tabrizica]|uniref:DNA polymerase V subunit UmuD n=1 Tax=Alishewanella tabrizica TaxID=671278 RepID=A0ABQ2WKT0_9ALTE|nr:translesion error-prone DNA polymerase V autoproteolytic subunit [Alishewanella tabrizica]GGW61614.1 DNA polymerase V subunit UmuD [Alishewanella tabrizica]